MSAEYADLRLAPSERKWPGGGGICGLLADFEGAHPARRQCYYGWKRRYEAEGFDGLKDRSSDPLRQPTKTVPDVMEKIPRAAAAVPLWAAEDLDVPRQYHDVTISASGVWRIFHKLNFGRLASSYRAGVLEVYSYRAGR